MELGGLGLDVGFHSCSENALDCDTSRLKWTSATARSAGFKQDGSGFWSDDCRSSKLAKTHSGFSPSSASSDVHMLSFSSSSSSKPDTSTLPYFQQLPGAPPKSAGYYSGALNTSACMYLLNGVRGPFTPSQWLELEQQALIYKYLTANEPIPAHLLIPIKKALESAGLFGFNAGPLRPTSWGWGPFHLGYSNSTDPEPGRCRRTDGKKWRCSRDAVPDQKYCERHINRGRHRSRKLVEAQAAKSATTATKPPLVAPGAGLSSNSFDMNPAMNNPLMDRMQDTTQLSFLTLSGSQKNSSFCSGNDGSSILWPGLQLPSDNMGTSDFLPLRHSQQLEMGLGVGAQSHDNRQANWMSSSWEPSMGGPLGEALQSSGGAQAEGKKTAALNLLPKGWEGMGSYQLSSTSPTGVLQRSALVSLSNSSAGSSPRADNSKTME